MKYIWNEHLEGEAAAGKRNHRNGYSKKTVLTEISKIDIRIPRDREDTFDPKLLARYQRRSRASTRRSC
jgi:putative transposase